MPNTLQGNPTLGRADMDQNDKEFMFRINGLPSGEDYRALTAGEAEELLLERLKESEGQDAKILNDLLNFYIKTWQTKKAWSCTQQLMEMTTNTEERADLFVQFGCIGEQMNDYAMAESFYRDSLRIGARGFMREYWAYNNLGYCLNQLGRPAEAQPYLNRAITLDPTRSNAFKNLGLCYQGLERFPDAVEMFIEATRANATDGRSLVHLDALIESYPALYEQVPELDVKVKMCRDAVDSARSMQPDFDDWWRNRRTKQDTENEDQT